MIRLLLQIPLFAIFCLSMQISIVAQDDVAALNKQLALLKQEIDLLKREVEILKKENAVLKKPSSVSKGDVTASTAGDEINGIIWEISFFNKSGLLLHSGKFLAANGKIYVKANEGLVKEIGVFSENADRSRLEVTGHDNPAANGTYNFLRIQKNPPSYEGNFRNKQGQQFPVKVRIVKD